MLALNHRFEFSGEQFLDSQDRECAGSIINHWSRGTYLRRQGTSPHQEIDFDLNLVEGPKVTLIPQVPLDESV